jgi:3-dehydroquinate dehydratase-2
MKNIWVLNGPNLNLLGSREPGIYGTSTLSDVEAMCLQTANAHGLALRFHQSNHEGQLVDWIHEAGREHAQGQLAGLVLNAGGYSFTSVALLDAIKATAIPMVELHISNVYARESFRHHSYISFVAKAVLCGFGVAGYSLAIQAIANW